MAVPTDGEEKRKLDEEAADKKRIEEEMAAAPAAPSMGGPVVDKAAEQHERRKAAKKDAQDFVLNRYAALGPDRKSELVKELNEIITKLVIMDESSKTNYEGMFLQTQERLQIEVRQQEETVAALADKEKRVKKEIVIAQNKIRLLEKRIVKDKIKGGKSEALEGTLKTRNARLKELKEELKKIYEGVEAQRVRLEDGLTDITIPGSEENPTTTRVISIPGGLRGAIEYCENERDRIKAKGTIFKMAKNNLAMGREPFKPGRSVGGIDKKVATEVTKISMVISKSLLTVVSCQFDKAGEYDATKLDTFREKIFRMARDLPVTIQKRFTNTFGGLFDTSGIENTEFLQKLSQLIPLGVFSMKQISNAIGIEEFDKHISANEMQEFNQNAGKNANIMYYKQDMNGKENPEIINVLKQFLFQELDMDDTEFAVKFSDAIKTGQITMTGINSVINQAVEPDLDPPFDIGSAIKRIDARLAEEKKKAEESGGVGIVGVLEEVGVSEKKILKETESDSRLGTDPVLKSSSSISSITMTFLRTTQLIRAKEDLRKEQEKLRDLQAKIEELERDKKLADEARAAVGLREAKMAAELREREAKIREETERKMREEIERRVREETSSTTSGSGVLKPTGKGRNR